MGTGSIDWNCKHKWAEVDGTRTSAGASYRCGLCGGLMSIGPGIIEREKTFEEKVIETVVADLKSNGKIRRAGGL
jgi:hypothetical protein